MKKTPDHFSWKHRMAETGWEFVSRQVWHPRWEQAVPLLAGQLSGPSLEQMLRSLADPRSDDVLRHRLALAARCLSAVPPDRLPQLQQVIDSVTTQVGRVWWQHCWRGTAEFVPHLAAAVRALALLPGQVRERLIPAWGQCP